MPTGLQSAALALPLGLFDKSLGFTCVLETELSASASQESYCLPSSQSWFADASCQTPVALASQCSSAPTYVAVQRDCALDSVRQVQPALASAATVYSWSNGGCHPRSGTYTVYGLSDPLPMSTFVRVTRTFAGDGRIRALAYAGEDGSHFTQPFYSYDSVLDTLCEAGVTSDHGMRCAPLTVAFTRPATFADSECLHTVAGISDACAAAQKFAAGAAVPDADACTSYATYDMLGAATETVWHEADVCTPGAAFGDTYGRYAAVSGALPVSALASFARSTVALDARLSLYRNSANGQASYADYRFYDAMLDGDCNAQRAADGVVRCLPVDGGLGQVVYTDSLCQSAIYEVDHVHCTKAPRFAVTAMDDACGGNAVQRVGAALASAGPIFLKDADGTCESVDAIPGAVFFAMGEALAASAFAPIITGRLDTNPGGR